MQRRRALRTRITKFRTLQAVYMPAGLAILGEDDKASLEVEHVEGVRLGLPSDFKATHRQRACEDKLARIESQLRTAQCNDALQDLRNKLHTLSHLYLYRKKNVRGQGGNTRARTNQNAQEGHKDRAVEKYRRARRALFDLHGPGRWEDRLQVLRDEDVRHMIDDDPDTAKKKRKRKDGPAEGHRVMSWIWRGFDTDKDPKLTDSFRVEWLKTRARPLRWGEEKRLCPEEMRRCLATLVYEERAWMARLTARTVQDPILQEGLIAYATDQQYIRVRMRDNFRTTCGAAAMKAGFRLEEEQGVAPLATDADPEAQVDSEAQADNDDYDNLARIHALDEEAAATL